MLAPWHLTSCVAIPASPAAVSATVTPVAQPCTDPHPEPPPQASWWLKCPSGSYLLLGVEPAASSQRPGGKMAHFPGPQHQTRLLCDSVGLELGPATRCPHAPPRGLEGRRAQCGWALAPTHR